MDERLAEAVAGTLMVYFMAKILNEIPRIIVKASIVPIALCVIFVYAAFNHHRWNHEDN